MQFENGFLSYVTDLHSVRAYLCQAGTISGIPCIKGMPSGHFWMVWISPN
jgi:hypothetical protein